MKRLTVEDVLTTGQIAKFCSVDPRTVNRWIGQHLLVAHTLPVTKFSRIQVKDFLRFLKEQKMPVPGKLKSLSGNRILIVDHNPSMLHSVQKILGQFQELNYEFELARDGFEAGQALQKFQPKLVILNFKMPGVDAMDICKRIKSHSDTRHIHVLAVAEKMETGEYKKFLKTGFDACLEKPFSEEALKHQILQLLAAEEKL